ncbi:MULTISPECIES: LacI family DNA-binding transcriptional regulator [Paraburkholderia]|uniref:LacI family DNA-binding transcriptional regulator n=1 Tax=Paraburkholderia TaxID=1822464 RepID=UPI002259EFF4|nr:MULTISPECIES: LacI family DNA-binding transcriptional regulator [Paraburkholderia]MCX4165528.1 LacI family DNA-binding transcriptional regulator [Paraburkholderia megapolitana]MDN7161019.1 LacI family DNA-binding transcriptional regulator [Paraburkholderia sp. CHISQ3]MDQ6498066.1 LacI family DNA-binding transcriptional regulator [Paraburkholderia megapolitana]
MQRKINTGATIQDIAVKAGVSKSTVSLVLQQSPKIKAQTTARVMAAASALGYVYNQGAANLRQRRSNTIGMIINDLTNPFIVELLVSVEHALAKAGYTTFMSHTAEDLDMQARVLQSMRQNNVAGLIMSPALDTPKEIPATIRSWGIPLVLLMRPLGGSGIDTVGVDNRAGFKVATEHLVERGHKRIAFAGMRPGYTVAHDRSSGYRAAMAGHGLPVDDSWMIDVPITLAGGREAVRRIFAMKHRPTAVVCYNDLVAFGVLHELDKMGKRAGKHLAVIGCDNVAASEHTNPPLTTLSAGADLIGSLASEVLLSRLRESSMDTPGVQHFEPMRLVVRESSGPPRQRRV